MIAGIFGMFFLGAVYMQAGARVRPPSRWGLAYLPVALSIGTFLAVRGAAAQHEHRPTGDGCCRAWCSWPPGLLLFAAAPVHAELRRPTCFR